MAGRFINKYKISGGLPIAFKIKSKRISLKSANRQNRKKRFDLSGLVLRSRIRFKIKLTGICSRTAAHIKNSRALGALKKPMLSFAAFLRKMCGKIWFAVLVALFIAFRLGVLLCKKSSAAAAEVYKKIYGIWFDLKSKTGLLLGSARRKQKESVLTFAAFAFIVCSMCMVNLGLEVTVDGQKLGRISSQQQFERILRSVESRAAAYLNHPYVLNSKVDYKFSIAGYCDEIDTEQAERFLFSSIDDISVSTVLRVDGQIVAACDSEQDLTRALNQILDDYEKKNSESKVSFVEKVETATEPVAKEYIMDASEIKQMLTQKRTTTGSYIVQKGDTLSGIALKCGIGVENLRAINQDINPNKIRIGQSIETSYSVAMLSIQETARVTYTENIAYETKVEKNDAMYTNERKVIVSGKYGTKQITADVTYLDGQETSRTVIEEKVMTQPVTRIEYVGTKKPPAKSATGTFRRPYGGYISSNYGYRGREFHTGVDFAGPAGSAIVAADGGTVTFAGRNGNYGKCVIIRHKTGLETLYAHCSSLNVKAGENVAKGQQIARVGSTGRATGPHVHFEVRVNGKYVNPWKYIN